jgi:hypothetical protein
VDERRRGVPSDAAVSRAMQADDHQSCQAVNLGARSPIRAYRYEVPFLAKVGGSSPLFSPHHHQTLCTG